MKRYLPFVIIALVALLAIGAGAMLYRAKRHPLPAAGDSPALVGRAEDKTAHVRGGANAIVTLEEFGDFQCPSCSLAAEAIFKVEKDYGPRSTCDLPELSSQDAFALARSGNRCGGCGCARPLLGECTLRSIEIRTLGAKR